VSGARPPVGAEWLAAAGLALVLVAPPLQLVSHAAFFILWYAGLGLVGVWLLTYIRRR
jgi:hypothetical protein